MPFPMLQYDFGARIFRLVTRRSRDHPSTLCPEEHPRIRWQRPNMDISRMQHVDRSAAGRYWSWRLSNWRIPFQVDSTLLLLNQGREMDRTIQYTRFHPDCAAVTD